MGYRLLIMLVLVLHFGFLAYLVLGGFLAWRWPRTVWLHLGAAAWGVLVTAAQLVCPLTYLEHWARRRAGETGVGRGFIDRYVEGVIYPERYAALAQALVAVLILVSWVGLFQRLGLFRGLRAARPPRPRRRLRWRGSR
ncbi:DUF2784 domain-containing protein [Plantactinospora sp. CA-294935]|uniref:DUF2784 domain-containing protein n=1 Tax=Plantactinospora sp. CA-294935 TaxID=3240012 RepID=UPI003D8BAAC5